MYVLECHDVVELMRMEYAEMPQLKLTFWQAQHLWNLSTEQCERALAALTASGFLAQTHDGAYIRRESVGTHLHKLWEARYSDTL